MGENKEIQFAKFYSNHNYLLYLIPWYVWEDGAGGQRKKKKDGQA